MASNPIKHGKCYECGCTPGNNEVMHLRCDYDGCYIEWHHYCKGCIKTVDEGREPMGRLSLLSSSRHSGDV